MVYQGALAIEHVNFVYHISYDVCTVSKGLWNTTVWTFFDKRKFKKNLTDVSFYKKRRIIQKDIKSSNGKDKLVMT